MNRVTYILCSLLHSIKVSPFYWTKYFISHCIHLKIVKIQDIKNEINLLFMYKLVNASLFNT